MGIFFFFVYLDKGCFFYKYLESVSIIRVLDFIVYFFVGKLVCNEGKFIEIGCI